MKGCFLILCFLVSALNANSQQFIFVFLNKKQHAAELPKEQLDKLMEGHMANIKRLAKEEKLLAAGPFDGGGGIFIFRTNSKDEVKEWLSTDPGVQAKRWDIEIFNYQPRVGSVCAVSEPYQMTNYSFVRYELNIAKYTISQLPDQLREHGQYLKQLSSTGIVVAEGFFDSQEGGILVIKGDLQPGLIENDPAIQMDFLTFATKKLYIAKGAFCEK
jgi:uncharacterized protein YciI